MDKILIYGSKEFASTIKQLTIDCSFEPLGFIDDINTGPGIIGNFEKIKSEFNNSKPKIALAIGYNDLQARRKIYDKIKSAGFELLTLVHPKSYVSATSKIGEGCFLMAGSVIDVNSIINPVSVIWPGAVINHDCLIDSNTFISPNATICGSVSIGKNCFIGAGSIIIDHHNLPDNTFVKAGKVYYTI